MIFLLNGFVLAFFNIASILVGFLVYYVSKNENQLAIQLVTSCTFNILSFLGWKFFCRIHLKKYRIRTKKQFILTLIFSMIFSPLIFILLHFTTQGYLTSFQNILSIWMYQVPTNILVLKLYHHFSQILKLREKLVSNQEERVETS